MEGGNLRLCVVVSGLGALGVGLLSAAVPGALVVSQPIEAGDRRHLAPGAPLHAHAKNQPDTPLT